MKQLLLGLLFFTCYSSTSAKDIFFGIKGGVNLSTWYGAKKVDVEENDMLNDSMSDYHMYKYRKLKPGFDIGLMLRIYTNDFFSLQPELHLNSKGYRQVIQDSAKYRYSSGKYYFKYEQRLNFHYIEVPVLFKFNIPNPSIIQPNLYFAPSFGFKTWISGSEELETPDGIQGGFYNDEQIDEINKSTYVFDFGASAGAGFDIVTKSCDIVFDVRYTLGLSNILKPYNERDGYRYSPMDDEPEVPDHRNSALTFMIGFMFKVSEDREYFVG